MKKQILALALTFVPIPSIAASPQACEAAKLIVELCLQFKTMNIREHTAIEFFENQPSEIQNIAKNLCSNVYKLEHTDKFQPEFISKLFYENCLKN